MRKVGRADRSQTWEAIILAAKMSCGFVMLPHKKFTLVDELDMDELSQFAWRDNGNGYVYRKFGPFGSQKFEYMHRRLMNPAPGLEVDHRNRKKSDNRRDNLRCCTRPQNAGNVVYVSARKTSKYKGVIKWKHGFYAKGKTHGKQVIIGGFQNEQDAARAYDAWAKNVFGEFARTNF